MGGVDLHDNAAKNEQKLQKRLLVCQNNVTAFSCCCKILLIQLESGLYLFVLQESNAIHVVSVSKQRSENLVQSSQHGIVFGPVWASKGEPFNPMGAYGYIMGLAIDLKQRIKKEEAIVESVSRISFIFFLF